MYPAPLDDPGRRRMRPSSLHPNGGLARIGRIGPEDLRACEWMLDYSRRGRGPALNRMIAANEQPLADAGRDEPAIEALLGRCAARDRAAFAELYQAAAPRLLACLLAILKRRDLAEDALQEVMVRIWQRSDQYDGYRGRPMAWLVSIARYHAIDQLRRRRPLVALDETVASRLADAEAQDSVEAAESSGTHSALERCLERLSAGERRSVVLAYSSGYSHEQIATALASPLGTVKSWVRRGLASLRECLGT
jgi:RNA polymerase sigma-70 factor (ECF subfamily)